MIRHATIADYDSIKKILNELALNVKKIGDRDYRYDVQRNGFLLHSELTVEQFKKDLKKIYFIPEYHNKVVGYLRIDEEQELSNSSKIYWFKPEVKNVYFSKPHANIGGMGVLAEAKSHGIGAEMLLGAEREVRAKGIVYLFSLVALSPVTNMPSMMFHEKHGFERIAVSEPHPLFGMNGYQSFLYGKKLFY